jgi:hypothetical protein
MVLGSGRHAEAERHLVRALALDAGDPQARFNLGLVQLSLGRFDPGWSNYEARAAVLRLARDSIPGVAEWRPGEPIAGRSIALKAEQGYGDVLHFCRYAIELARRGARPALLVPPSLKALLSTLDDRVGVYTAGDPQPHFDLQCWLLGVPYRLGGGGPPEITFPYLHVAAGERARWSERISARLPGARIHVGLACSGSSTHANDARRSVPLAAFAPLVQATKAKGVCWHFLQSELRTRDADWIGRLGLQEYRQELADFSQTAALTSCMDAVVSVDTAVAHLCGALGLPLHLLIPDPPDWRWQLARGDTPWYPSAQLHRQSPSGDWAAALAGVQGRLMRLVA